MLFSEDTDLLENQRTVQWKQIWNLCWKLQHQSFRIKRQKQSTLICSLCNIFQTIFVLLFTVLTIKVIRMENYTKSARKYSALKLVYINSFYDMNKGQLKFGAEK